MSLVMFSVSLVFFRIKIKPDMRIHMKPTSEDRIRPFDESATVAGIAAE
jgi:hypothetical protein